MRCGPPCHPSSAPLSHPRRRPGRGRSEWPPRRSLRATYNACFARCHRRHRSWQRPIGRQDGGKADQRIGAEPQRLARRSPSAIAMTTTISSARGASATDTVIVSKCSNDHESSLWSSGTSSGVPGEAILILRRDHRLTAPDRGAHRVPEHWMHAGSAMLHFSSNPDEGAFRSRPRARQGAGPAPASAARQSGSRLE